MTAQNQGLEIRQILSKRSKSQSLSIPTLMMAVVASVLSVG